MSQTIILNKQRQPVFYIFSAFWSLLLLANFVPAIPQPEVIIGYLWKVEFALAAFLLVALVLFIKTSKDKIIRFSRQEILSIILPLVLFTVWSGFSVFWAKSQRDAIHHTLLWACYCIFYFLIRQIVNQPKSLAVSFKITGLVIFILGTACIAEYLNNPEEISSFFTYRYYKYAEASVTLLPIFLALALQSKTRMAFLSGAVAIIAWLVVLLSLSRTIFAAGFVCLGLFFALFFLFQDWKKHLKKLILVLGLLALCVFVSQIKFSSASENATINRFNGSENSQASFNSRFLFWGIALEAFQRSPVIGVGADNYIRVYGTARESYSANDQGNKLLEINEDVLAERAHNEYLQILSELGIVGAALFAWMLGGIAYLFFSLRKKRVSMLSIAAFAGISAFLISSIASSYSFRVPANGLCFFFLLALAARSLKSQVPSPKSEKLLDSRLKTLDFRLVFALMICASMLIFSAVRGASLMYLQFAHTSLDETEAEQYFQSAIALDSENAAFRYYYGAELYNNNRSDEAIPQMRLGIDRGIATSVAYFDLASAQIISEKPLDAEQTFAQAIRVYPRSVFLRTSYAVFLAENGKDTESQIEYEKALQINTEQAKSWWIAHTEGMKNLTQAGERDKDLVKAMDLKPTNAIYALLDFQRQFNPKLVRR